MSQSQQDNQSRQSQSSASRRNVFKPNVQEQKLSENVGAILLKKV